jgi:hypothetical protein
MTHEHVFGLSLWAHGIRLPPRGSHGAPGLRTHRQTAPREGNGAGSSPARRIPARSGKRPTRHRRPTGDSRHDHPDAPARRRGHPWPLVAAPGVTTTSTLGLGECHNPTARSARDFYSPLRVPKALLRANRGPRVTYDHPRSPENSHPPPTCTHTVRRGPEASRASTNAASTHRNRQTNGAGV